jgi:hypothetical protein
VCEGAKQARASQFPHEAFIGKTADLDIEVFACYR